MQRWREIFAVILFGILLCIQVVDLHAFSHHCENEDSGMECTFCAVAIDLQEESFLLPEIIELPEFQENIPNYTIPFLTQEFFSAPEERQLCVRPPPSLS